MTDRSNFRPVSRLRRRPLLLLAALLALPAAAQERVGQVTGLPIPRFVSLAAPEVNVRAGPGGDYPIA